jgi:16S rRNA C1402 (ribose-2'-O) methylase RsmI
MSPRSLSFLQEADFWIVEDTRMSGKLGQLLGIKKPMKIVNDFTGDEAIPRHSCPMVAHPPSVTREQGLWIWPENEELT